MPQVRAQLGAARDLVACLFAGGLAVACFVAAFRTRAAVPPAEATAIGTIEIVRRDVRGRLGGALSWEDAEEGRALFDGDAIYACAGSEAWISLRSGGRTSRLRVAERSLVVVSAVADARRGPSVVSVELVRGDVHVEGGGDAQLRVGPHSLGLREGATLDVRMREDGSARIDVVSGEASVGDALLRPGERRIVGPSAGQLSEAEAIDIDLVSPRESARVVHPAETSEPVVFSWRGLPGVSSYTLELAHDPGFAELFATVTVSEPRASRSDLDDGPCYWRVVAASPRGRVVSPEWSFTLASEAPPEITRPSEGDEVVVTADSPLEIAIRSSGPVDHYVIELDRASGPRWRVETRSAVWTAGEEVPVGRTCVRVRVEPSALSEAAAWSARRCFVVRSAPRLRAPTLFDPSVDRGETR